MVVVGARREDWSKLPVHAPHSLPHMTSPVAWPSFTHIERAEEHVSLRKVAYLAGVFSGKRSFENRMIACTAIGYLSD